MGDIVLGGGGHVLHERKAMRESLQEISAMLAESREAGHEDRSAIVQASKRMLSRFRPTLETCDKQEILEAVRRIYSNFASKSPEVAMENIRTSCELLVLEGLSRGALAEGVMVCLREWDYLAPPTPAFVYKKMQEAQQLLDKERRLLETLQPK